MRIIKGVGFSVLGLSLIVATGCSRESKQTAPAQTQTDTGRATAPESARAAKERNEALVRVVNAVPDSSPIAVTADQTAAFERVDAKQVTPYKPIPASADDFAVKTTADESAQPIAENREAIMSGRHYTLVVFPESPAVAGSEKNEKKMALDVIADDLVPPPPGKARIRVINAAQGTDDVAVYLKDREDALFTDVDFKETVSYVQVDPMNTTLELRTDRNALMDVNPKTGDRTGDAATPPADRADRSTDRAASERAAQAEDRAANASRQPGQVLGTHGVNLEAGKSYTIVLVGGAAGRQLETLVVEDMVPETETAAPTE